MNYYFNLFNQKKKSKNQKPKWRRNKKSALCPGCPLCPDYHIKLHSIHIHPFIRPSIYQPTQYILTHCFHLFWIEIQNEKKKQKNEKKLYLHYNYKLIRWQTKMKERVKYEHMKMSTQMNCCVFVCAMCVCVCDVCVSFVRLFTFTQ